MKPKSCLALVYDNGDVFIDSTVKSAQDYTGLAREGESFKVERVTLKKNEKRSLTASALFHVWVQQLSGFTGYDVINTKSLLKRDFGWPILQREQPEYAKRIEFILQKIGYYSYSEEQQLKVWSMFDVTSIMSTSELREMMSNIKEWTINTYDFTLDNGKREDAK